MPRWFSPNSEILILAFIGFVITVIEAMYMNLNSNLVHSWKLAFPENLLTSTAEYMTKSVIAGIIIIRGVTVHVYLASYLLLIFPVLKERRRILLLVWLMVSGFRTILVNGVATLIGLFLCSCAQEPHPSCFEFITVKGIEIACSVYMWVIVNEFMFYLKRVHRASEARDKTSVKLKKQRLMSNEDLDYPFHDGMHIQSEQVDSDSEFSFASLDEDSHSSLELSEGSSDSLMAKAAVNWFFRTTLGMKCHGKRADKDEEWTQKFLKMSPEEVEALTLKIKKFLAKKYTKGGKLVKILSNQYLGNEVEQVKLDSYPGDKSMSSHEQFLRKSSIFCNSSIMPNNNESIFINKKTTGVQTDKLPQSILKKMARQEKEIMSSTESQK